jgi:Methyltransferase domain
VCSPQQLMSHDGCVVCSIGSNGKASFESAILADVPHCQMHTFDPTLTPSLAAKVGEHHCSELDVHFAAAAA